MCNYGSSTCDENGHGLLITNKDNTTIAAGGDTNGAACTQRARQGNGEEGISTTDMYGMIINRSFSNCNFSGKEEYAGDSCKKIVGGNWETIKEEPRQFSVWSF